jgi:hypothetical protein
MSGLHVQGIQGHQRLLVLLLLAGVALLAATTLGLGGPGRAQPFVVSLRGPLATTLDPANLSAEAALERRLARLPGVRSVLGPATLIERQASALSEQIDRLVARQHPASRAAARKDLDAVLVHYGYIGRPSLRNQSFIGELIFGAGVVPLRRFAAVLPDAGHARVVILPRAELAAAGLRRLTADVRRLVTGAQLQGVEAVLR